MHQLGAGLLMSVRARDQQVGLGCGAAGGRAWDGDPTGQGSGRECGSGGGGRGGALWASLQLPCGRK